MVKKKGGASRRAQGHGRQTSAFGVQNVEILTLRADKKGRPSPVVSIVGVLWGGVSSGRALRPCPSKGRGEEYMSTSSFLRRSWLLSLLPSSLPLLPLSLLPFCSPLSVDFVLRTSFFLHSRSVPQSIRAPIRRLSASQYVRIWLSFAHRGRIGQGDGNLKSLNKSKGRAMPLTHVAGPRKFP